MSFPLSFWINIVRNFATSSMISKESPSGLVYLCNLIWLISVLIFIISLLSPFLELRYHFISSFLRFVPCFLQFMIFLHVYLSREKREMKFYFGITNTWFIIFSLPKKEKGIHSLHLFSSLSTDHLEYGVEIFRHIIILPRHSSIQNMCWFLI